MDNSFVNTSLGLNLHDTIRFIQFISVPSWLLPLAVSQHTVLPEWICSKMRNYNHKSFNRPLKPNTSPLQYIHLASMCPYISTIKVCDCKLTLNFSFINLIVNHPYLEKNVANDCKS